MKTVSALIGIVVATLLLAASAQGTSEGLDARKKPKPSPPAIRFTDKLSGRLVVTTPAYRLTLSKDNGSLLELVDRRDGVRLVRGQTGCLWTATLNNAVPFGGCAYSATGANRFSYRWNRAATALTLRYDGTAGDARASATVVVAARKQYVDLRLELESHVERPVAAVLFPADLVADATIVEGVYMPTFLPGVKFLPSFLSSPRRNVERYPSRWAFADLVAADFGRSHLAVYSVNPSPAPIAPVDIGVIHGAEPDPCSAKDFCLTHVFQTWLAPGATWASPRVRLRVGGSAEQSVVAYRQDNGIEKYPTLAEKLGDRLNVLARAPLVKADPWKGLPRFAEWGPALRRLPSPALLHPAGFQARGHDEDYPDFLPPDPRWGTLQDFNATLNDARSLGQLVMPYLNVSWWDTQSPSVRLLPPPLTPADISMQTAPGTPVTEQFGNHDGYIVSPFAPAVRQRVDRLFEEWRTEVPADCVFFDQIGARPWRRDFNPASPNPLAYADGWLAIFEKFRDRCLMAEDGWDRLADAFVGFHGGVLALEREHRWASVRWGAGNWEPYPLALWLLHDKVLLYQHDLYEGTMTDDPEVLLFNIAFGLVLSYSWDGETHSLDSPWLRLVGDVQKALGPHYVGRPLTAFRQLAPAVTESAFGDYSVVANWSTTAPYDLDGQRIAPLGFLARDRGQVLAGTFGDTWSGVTIPSG